MKKYIHNFSVKYMSRIAALFLLDIFSIFVASFFSLFIRFDFSFFNIPTIYLEKALYLLPINLLVTLILYYFLKLYKSVW